jgi:5-methyltetrahydropteroyltriglutamate--homocysteine methyltransferase
MRKYAPLFPDFLGLNVDEIHLEMASREYAELEMIEKIAPVKDVSIGVIDVKSYFIESPEHIAEKVRLCLRHAPADRLSFSPDCGLSQTARWAARQKLANMVSGVQMVKKELGLV